MRCWVTVQMVTVVLAAVALPAYASRGFTVKGNQILDPAGHPFLVRGVDRPSLEWDHQGVQISLADFQLMATQWRANTVRIALNQDFWLKGAGEYDPSYPETVAATVQEANQAGLVVILDLHWSDRGDLKDQKPGQQLMADANSIEFWREVAKTFQHNPDVMFELYNEPHDIPWDVWQNGGTTRQGWTAAGMQQLVDAIRRAGANNVVIAGGVGWASDLTGVPSHRLRGRNIAYATHQYASQHGPDVPNPTWWDRSFGELSKTVPIVATEFGDYDDNPAWEAAFLDYCQHPAGGVPIGWTCWAWFPGGPRFPAIIRDWQGDPTNIGAVVQAALLGESYPAEPVPH